MVYLESILLAKEMSLLEVTFSKNVKVHTSICIKLLQSWVIKLEN